MKKKQQQRYHTHTHCTQKAIHFLSSSCFRDRDCRSACIAKLSSARKEMRLCFISVLGKCMQIYLHNFLSLSVSSNWTYEKNNTREKERKRRSGFSFFIHTHCSAEVHSIVLFRYCIEIICLFLRSMLFSTSCAHTPVARSTRIVELTKHDNRPRRHHLLLLRQFVSNTVNCAQFSMAYFSFSRIFYANSAFVMFFSFSKVVQRWRWWHQNYRWQNTILRGGWVRVRVLWFCAMFIMYIHTYIICCLMARSTHQKKGHTLFYKTIVCDDDDDDGSDDK